MLFFAWIDSSVPILICPASQEIGFASVPAIPIHRFLGNKNFALENPKSEVKNPLADGICPVTKRQPRRKSKQRIPSQHKSGDKLRSWSGLAFLLEVAVEEDKAQSKQAKDQSVFLRFGDDLVVDDNPHLAAGTRKTRE